MSNDHDGLIFKYCVFKIQNGQLGELVDNCFVLRPDKDLAARYALRTYSRYCESASLAQDINDWLAKIERETKEEE